jgi:hypothetical protein
MRPEFIDRMSWEMAEVYGAVTDQILINLAHYFPYYNAKNFPRSSITYQADMLAQMGQVNKETMRIIRRNLVGADRHLKAALEQVIIDSVQEANPELVQAVKRGIFNPPQVPVVAPNQYKAFNLYYKQAADKLNLVNTVMLESTQQAYAATVADVAARIKATQTALDIGAGETITGVSAWNKATAHAISRLKRDGITGFIDHGGHRWSAEAYVAMDIRTTMANTGRAAVWETNQNFGNDLYQVSYHNGARPLCYPWQSKVISSTDDARTVTDLDGNEIQVYAQSKTSYGEPAGLFGINCKHYPTPFIPGVSLIRAGGQSEEENAKTYEESQQQRAMERKLREEKRDLLMLKEQGAPDELIKAQRAKIRQTDDDIDAFCKETGRARRQNREAVYTKREFPSAKTYDVALFEQKQKEMFDSFYSGGGAQRNYTFGQMTPNVQTVQTPAPVTQTPPVVPETPQEVFTPAKTIQEAEEYAKTFTDTSKWGSYGIHYDGLSVDTANVINQRLSNFYNTYDVEKFSSVVAPAGNTRLGKAISNAQAGYNPYNKSFAFNRKTCKTPAIAIKKLAEEKELVTRYIENPSSFEIATQTAKRVLDASIQSGRATVPSTLEEIIDHELGHALTKKLLQYGNFDVIRENWKTFAPGVSGYATINLDEYIAESFCAWIKGEHIADTELVKAFEFARR